MDILRALLDPWTWRMAWRDSRRSRGRLVLYSFSISLGIAALVALGSLCDSLRDSLSRQSKSLLGADLVLSSSVPPSAAATDYMNRLGEERASVTRFSTAVSAPGRDAVRFAYVNAITGGFPFHGRIDAEPATSVDAFRQGQGVLVSDSLAQQLALQVGDSVVIGHWTAPVVGVVRWMPGDSMSVESLAPRICMAGSRLPQVINPARRSMIFRQATNVIEKATNVRYQTFVRMPEGAAVEAFVAEQAEHFNRHGLGVDTVAQRQYHMGNAFADLGTFLNLSAFVALLLGTVGISTVIRVHVQQRVAQVALLRCLGAPLASTFAIYFLQAFALGSIGSLVGLLLGAAALQALPAVFGRLVLVEFQAQLSWVIVAQSLVAGVGLSVAFALLPLLGLRRISPLVAIRAAHESPRNGIDGLRAGLVLGICLLILGFAVLQSHVWNQGMQFATGLAVTFLLLSGVAVALVRGARGLSRPWMPFAWRQGVASLHRPHNRTQSLLVSLGLVTFLVVVMQGIRSSLLAHLDGASQAAEPNLLVFDVRSQQLPELGRMLQRHRLPAAVGMPLINLQVVSVNDRPLKAAMAKIPVATGTPPNPRTNGAIPVPRWLPGRTHHATVRAQLGAADTLVAGRWPGPVATSAVLVPLVIDQDVAAGLAVGPGDHLGLQVQGTSLECEVVGVLARVQQSLNRLQKMNPVVSQITSSLKAGGGTNQGTNFRFVFPEGALDPALVRHVLATRCDDPVESGRFQVELARAFPSASVVDLSRLHETVASLLGKSVSAIRFVGLFTVCTGIYVLVGTILTGRWQRAREGLLLRTLGASRNQVRRVLLVEYLLLGGLAGATGGGLALAAGWTLARFVFGVPFHPVPLELGGTFLAMPVLTVLVGVATGRGVANVPPLEVLRQEG